MFVLKQIYNFMYFYWGYQQYFSYIMATSFSGGRSQSTRGSNNYHGQATGKLYHLWLRVECTFFLIYNAGHEPTPYW
jgi:hypothetical protein